MLCISSTGEHHHSSSSFVCDAFSLPTRRYSFKSYSDLDSIAISKSKLILRLTKDSSLQSNQSESDEVRELILTLSIETDDEQRRTKLKSLLEGKLTQDDAVKSAKFAHLWDTNIIKIGGEIQNNARLEAGQKSTSNNQQNENGTVGSEKNENEKQLWAMVDMMVQSKSIIKQIMKEK